MAASVRRAIPCAALAVLLTGLSGAGASASVVPPPAYYLAAREAGVPAAILFAVALQESGTTVRGRHMPWPWTLNVAGRAHHLASRAEACQTLQAALRRVPAKRIDVGLGQLNVGYQGHRVAVPCDLLDPHRNLALTATILREQHRSGEDWLAAIGRYHRPAGGAPATRYRHSVERHLTRQLGAEATRAVLQGTHR